MVSHLRVTSVIFLILVPQITRELTCTSQMQNQTYKAVLKDV